MFYVVWFGFSAWFAVQILGTLIRFDREAHYRVHLAIFSLILFLAVMVIGFALIANGSFFKVPESRCGLFSTLLGLCTEGSQP